MNLTLEKVILVWNIVVFLLFGLDKWRAGNKKHRSSEFSLLCCSFFFGALGAMFGMVIFNHKTSKPNFRFLVPIFVFLNPFVLELFKKYVLPYIVTFINSL